MILLPKPVKAYKWIRVPLNRNLKEQFGTNVRGQALGGTGHTAIDQSRIQIWDQTVEDMTQL